ncbi:MAG: AAA family ATPase [Gammaproteobacteria bacterium]
MLNIDALKIDARPHPAEKAAAASDTRPAAAGGLAPRPRTVADTGLSESLLQELVAKHLREAGILDLGELASRTALGGPIVEELVGALRAQMLIEVKGPAPGTAGLRYALTDRGRAFALEALARSGYIGPAPVPLARYTEVVKSQSVHAHRVTHERMHEAFADTVIRQDLLDQLGAALHSGRSIFVYGPPGSGKSYLCRRLARLLGEPVLIPHAIAVGDTEVQVFDPIVHRPLREQHRASHQVTTGCDPRFVLCERPAVITGGELTMDMLEMAYDPAARRHQAPLQMKAANGVYVIDDLGRQRAATVDLFNRWIVPLETRIDHLSLASGKRFPVPFDVVLVFATNLDPARLADEAFLRRIGHKIPFGALSRDEYGAIWQGVCADRDIAFDAKALRFTLALHDREGVPLLPCHPRDLLGMALDHAWYLGQTSVTPELIEMAWNNYFVVPGTTPGR